MDRTMSEWGYWAWRLCREWKALLLVLGLAVLIVAVGRRCAFAPSQHESRVETGEIVRFGSWPSKYGRPLVLVRTADGRVRQLMVNRSALRGCRRGDRIALERRGAKLDVHPAGCRHEK